MRSPRATSALVLALGCGLVLACGGAPRRSEPARPAVNPLAARLYPASLRIPGQATYVVMVARLDAATELLSDLLKPLGRVDRGFSPEYFSRAMRQAIGIDPLSAADLAEHGFAVDRTTALFSTGVFPTFMFPVADRARVAKLLEKITRQTTVVVAEVKGMQVTTWREGNFQASLALTDEWLYVHISDKQVEVRAMQWMEEIAEPATPLAAEADLGWVLDRAGEARRDVIGLVRAPALWSAFRAVDEVLGVPRKGEGCEALHARAVASLGRIAAVGALGDRKLDGEMFVELGADAAAALAGAVAAPPSRGYRALRDDAALAFSWAVDLGWLGREFGAYARADCGVLMEGIWVWRLGELRDPFERATGQKPLGSYHLALIDARFGLGGADVSAVGWFGVIDEAAVKRLLDGGLRPRTVSGPRGLTVYEAELGPLVSDRLRWVFDAGALRMSMGRGLLEKLLDGEAAQGAAPELGAFVLRPGKIPDVANYYGVLKSALDEYTAEMLAFVIAEIDWMTATATLEGGGIRVVGGFQLR